MSNLMRYRKYIGTVEFSGEDNCFFGKVIGIKSLLSYEGKFLEDLKKDFQCVVDDYLEDCKERGVTPEQPYNEFLDV